MACGERYAAIGQGQQSAAAWHSAAHDTSYGFPIATDTVSGIAKLKDSEIDKSLRKPPE